MNHLLAVLIDPPLQSGRTVSQTFPTASALISVILQNAITIAGVILLVLLISGGVMFIIGAGSQDSKKSAQAKSMITDALIGFAVVLFAYFIIQIIETITGLNILNNTTL
jgi:hypothetical protein